MFRRQGRRTNPDGLSQSVESHEAASPYRHPRYHRPSAKEKLIPLVRSAATGRLRSVAPHPIEDDDAQGVSIRFWALYVRVIQCCLSVQYFRAIRVPKAMISRDSATGRFIRSQPLVYAQRAAP